MNEAVVPRAGTWPRGPFATIAIGVAVVVALNLLAANVALPPLPEPLRLGPMLRVGIVVPIFFGVRFGPLVGFCVGAIGTLISDIATFGFFWNWEIGVGLVGAVAGSSTVMAGSLREGWWVYLATEIVRGAVAIIVGTGFATLTDVWVANLGWNDAISAEWIPTALYNLAWGVPLATMVNSAWWAARRRR